MKVGITLPQFQEDARSAVDAAERAEALGIDGVFCFDHLWPLGQPGRPALSSGPLLGAVVASTSTIAVGTLVARIGLVPDDVLIQVLCGLHAMSGGRMIAGMGTGDSGSRDENDAYGVPFEPRQARRARLSAVAEAVSGAGVPVWLGGAGDGHVDLARDIGAAVNLWEVEPARVIEVAERGVEVTWGGPVGETERDATSTLGGLAEAGATWAVCAWPSSIELIADVATSVRG